MYSTRKHNNWNTPSATYIRTYVAQVCTERQQTSSLVGTCWAPVKGYVCTYVHMYCTTYVSLQVQYGHTVHTWYNEVQHRDVDITPSLPSTTVLLNTPPPALALCNEAD